MPTAQYKENPTMIRVVRAQCEVTTFMLPVIKTTDSAYSGSNMPAAKPMAKLTAKKYTAAAKASRTILEAIIFLSLRLIRLVRPSHDMTQVVATIYESGNWIRQGQLLDRLLRVPFTFDMLRFQLFSAAGGPPKQRIHLTNAWVTLTLSER